jgi:protein-disulfide isomerase
VEIEAKLKNDDVQPVQDEVLEAAPAYVEPVATVSRATLNYVIIGITMFALGLLVGVVGYDRVAQANRAENRDLVNQVAERVISALGAAGGANSGPQLDPSQVYVIDEAGNPALGPDDATVTIIEFGDFRCSFCRRFQDETIAPLLERYEGRVRFVWRDYPILGQGSFEASIAGECADDQGQFWAFHDLLFADQANFTRAGFIAKATQLEMNVEQFTTCYDNQQHREEILADYQAGESLGVTGTPTFFINGRPLIGAQPIDAFVNVVEAELAGS